MKGNNRPIGLFDSGVGGLTIAAELSRQIPHEQYIFYGDTAHLPYGDKSPETIREYTRYITRFLLSYDVKAIVIACNTASAVAADVVIEEAGATPVIEVIGPTVSEAMRCSSNLKLGILATHTTIKSQVYRKRILQLNPEALVYEKASPLLVPLIEEGWIDHPACRMILETYLSDPNWQEIDTVILGCTHYPLLRGAVDSFFRNNSTKEVLVLDSSVPSVKVLQETLSHLDLLAMPNKSQALNRYFVSDISPHFQSNANRFLNQEIELEYCPLTEVFC